MKRTGKGVDETTQSTPSTTTPRPKKDASISPAGFLGMVVLAAGAVIWHSIDPTSKFQKMFAQYSLGLFFTSAGFMHFQSSLIPLYLNLMPSFLPLKKELVYLSGVIEILFGLLMFVPSPFWTNVGAWGILATLIAVYPANINHALSKEVQQKTKMNATMAYIRLPIQFLFFAWAYINTTITAEETYQGLLSFIQK